MKVNAFDATQRVYIDDPEAYIGRKAGNLKLVSVLGAGGMGVVYRAEHPVLQTPYAIKVLHPKYARDRNTVHRFRREAIACSKLRHENIVFVTDFGLTRALGLYLVMEHLNGCSLKDLLRSRSQISLDRVGRIGLQICAAMHEAHRLEIVHRDLKPDNVMLLQDRSQPDFVKILDFGIAHIRGDDERNDGSIVGTPAFMAPEQLLNRSEFLGAHTDIYALGCLFFSLLTGRPPFRADTDEEVLTLQVRERAPLLSSFRSELKDTLLEGLLVDMLQKDISSRPESMRRVRDRLSEAMEELASAGLAGMAALLDVDPSDHPTHETHPPMGTMPSLHMTTVIRQIRTLDPNSSAGTLLAVLPSTNGPRSETLCRAILGVLQQDLMDYSADSEESHIAREQLVLLLQAVLENHKESSLTPVQKKIFRHTRVLLNSVEPDQRAQVIEALRPLGSRPLFPRDLLPSDAWDNLRSAMTQDIGDTTTWNKLRSAVMRPWGRPRTDEVDPPTEEVHLSGRTRNLAVDNGK